jgi:hypothetical protein
MISYSTLGKELPVGGELAVPPRAMGYSKSVLDLKSVAEVLYPEIRVKAVKRSGFASVFRSVETDKDMEEV